MVNEDIFKEAITYSRPKHDVFMMILIELNHYVLDNLEEYYKQKSMGVSPNAIHSLKARIIRLFETIKHHMLKHSAKETIKKIDELIGTTNLIISNETFFIKQDIIIFLELHDYIRQFLLDKKVTEFVNKREYDPYDPTEEDKNKGF